MPPRLAIVERLPGHTEIMGTFASAALEFGYEPHLLFNQKDEFHMIDYLQKRLSIPAEQVHDWSYVNDPNANFDTIVLNTSVVWLDYGWQLRQWNSTKRLLVLHHHPDDIEMNPFGAPLYLTPTGGDDKWIFPVFSETSDANNDSGVPHVSPQLRDVGPPPLPTLTIVGSMQSKDLSAVADYLKIGGKIIHYDRHRCDVFNDYASLYTHIRGLGGTQLVAALCQQTQPLLLWMAVIPASNYTTNRFTGALNFGVDLNCVMIMPERLRALYEFPGSSVITYQAAITEPDCLAKLQAPSAELSEQRKQIQEWAKQRWQKNLAILEPLLRP